MINMSEPPKRPTGQHLSIAKTGNIPTMPDVEPPAEVVVPPLGNSDLDLLPRRFDFFASEVRDFMGRTARELSRLSRLESEQDNSQQWAQKRYVLLVDKIDALDKKLDVILAALAKGS